MKPKLYILFVIIVCLLTETVFTINVLWINGLFTGLWTGLAIGLPTALALYAGADCGRMVLLTPMRNRLTNLENRNTQIAGVTILCGYLLVVPILPMLAMWTTTHVIIDPLLNQKQHLPTLTEAYLAALSLAMIHGLLMLRGVPGSIRGVKERLFTAP